MKKSLKVYVGAGLIALTALVPGAAIAHSAPHYPATIHGHSHHIHGQSHQISESDAGGRLHPIMRG